MRRNGQLWRPDLSDAAVRASLPCRPTAYYLLIAYGRHLGILRRAAGDLWSARLRTKSGSYRRKILGLVAETAAADGVRRLSYAQAIAAAETWFSDPNVHRFASEQFPVGVRRTLIVSPIGKEFSVAHAMLDYIEWKRLVSAKSHFETNLSLVNHHIIPRLGNVRVEGFTVDTLRAFVLDVLQTPPRRGRRRLAEGTRVPVSSLDEEALRKRKKTVNALISMLRQAFKMAWESRKIDDDRSWQVLRHIPLADRPRTLHLSRNESRQLLEACRPDLARLVLGALYTGCRSSELTRMRCSQVGRDGYGVYIAPLKTHRPRFVFLPDEGMYWFLSLIEGRRPDDFVFVRENGLPWYDAHRSLFKEAVISAGLPREFSFHGLRHTYASQLVQAGATVFAVAEQLGHADPATVLRTYGHLSPQIREAEVRQRFTTLSAHNQAMAATHREALHRWRSDLHGGDWRTYATITDVPNFDSDVVPNGTQRTIPRSSLSHPRWISGLATPVVRRRRTPT